MRRKRKTFRGVYDLFFVVVALFLFFFTRGAEGEAWSMTLVHTADTYSELSAVDRSMVLCEPTNSSYVSPSGNLTCQGGMPRVKTVVDAVRARSEHVVLIDAGNILKSSLFFYLFGPSLIASYFNALEYDFIHWQVADFVSLVPNVVDFMLHADPGVQFVVSNLVGFANDARANGTLISAYGIKTFNATKQKVGFAGTMAQGVSTLIGEPREIDSTEESNALLIAVAAMVNRGVNKIVAAVSSNRTAGFVLASVPGIDILIVPDQDFGAIGSPYPQVYQAAWEQPVLVVSSGLYGQRVGVLDVTFDENGVITSYGGHPVRLNDTILPDPQLQARLVEEYAHVEAQSSRVIGYSSVPLRFETACLFSECTIADWVSDNLRRLGNTQVAFVNGGSIRSAIGAGPITLGQLQTAFPFGSADHFVYKLRGRHLLEALENGVSLATRTDLDVNTGAGRFLQVSGIRFSYNPNETVFWRVVDAWIEVSPGRWELIDLMATYTVSSLNWFIVYGGDNYTMVRDNAFDIEATGYNLNRLLFETIERNITSVAGDRITITEASRRSCLSDNNTICNGNGYCLGGECKCTAPGASGELCTFSASNSDSTPLGLGVALGIAVPLIVVLTLLAIALCLYAYRGRRRRLDTSWEIDIDELQLGMLLGAGGFGEVYKSTWKGTEVAVKVMNARSAGKQAAINFKQEVNVMTALRHPNVVLFMAACTKPPRMCIVMEYMALGSLFELLHNDMLPSIPFVLATKLAYQAAKGMVFLHSSGIVHRDLKSLNLLLDAKWNIKVSDFGLTKFRANLKREGENMQGTIHWISPEVLADKDDIDYMQADVYSFGIILWELITREHPYRGLSPPSIAVGVIRDGMRPDQSCINTQDTNPEFIKLMTECWDQDPVQRPTFVDAMDRLSSMLESRSSLTRSTSSSSDSLIRRASGSSTPFPSPTHKNSPMGVVAEAAAPAEDELAVVVSQVADAPLLWAANPSAMRKALSIHNKLLRTLIDKHHGYESILSRNHASSDGTFCVVFAKSADAFEWCDDIHQQLAKAIWPDDLGKRAQEEIEASGLRACVGVHFGHVERTRDFASSRHEFFGAAVEVATQLAAQAKSGQVLASHEFVERLHSDAGDSRRSIAGRFSSLMTIEWNSPEDRSLKEVRALLLNPSPKEAPQKEEKQKEVIHNSASEEQDEDSLKRNKRRRRLLERSDPTGCRWILEPNELEIVKHNIGQGSYGIVSKARWRGADVAVKRFVKQRLDEDTMLRFREEAALMADLRHPNVVLFLGACVQRPNMCIVTEWITRGSLHDVLSDTSIKLSWPTRLRMLHGIALGLSYLHSLSPPILHRDLKSSNVLIDDAWNAKIADFGFARIKEENVTMTNCGTPAWIAPEVLQRERYTEQADIYSLGVVMWEVATRRVPFDGENLAKISFDVIAGKRPPVPSSLPEDFADLVTRSWHAKPAKRPTAEEVCSTLAQWLHDASSDGHELV